MFVRVRRGAGAAGTPRVEAAGARAGVALHPAVHVAVAGVLPDGAGADACAEAYARAVRPLVASVAEGFHACLAVLGETGSGRASALAGGGPPRDGLAVPLLHGLFDALDAARAPYAVAVQCARPVWVWPFARARSRAAAAAPGSPRSATRSSATSWTP